ncbi:hypothetical protein J6590_019589 [Homalodisca vitripennis]|nr:hypothetical protein J6590_019589 [Homalodisca vitripennis]
MRKTECPNTPKVRTETPGTDVPSSPLKTRPSPSSPGPSVGETGICARLRVARSSRNSNLSAHCTLHDQGLTWLASYSYRY